MAEAAPTRDQIAAEYLEKLVHTPYPVQEEALLTYFTSDQGVLVCVPTGTGKTLVGEAALYEALRTGTTAYYTTPLIALTEQKFSEIQAAAIRWGFSADDVGLVTGNRKVNPQARVLVVVAEILLNRLLHREAFDFADVSAVVMDEFHNFADPERGIVWELSLGLLPPHVRLLLLSATVGNAYEFTQWLRSSHQRSIELVQSTERKVPLQYSWVGDQLLNDQIELMATGTDESRYTPALIFCFNRDQCWNVAEQLKGKSLLAEGQQSRLADELARHSWSDGAGPKLKQVLQRGVGIHHAGILPKYRRVIEHLFQQKLLSVCVCTETLAAGINLPARSVVLPTLMKGPPGDMKVIDSSSAHQIFGRAGRPQFDKQGYVFVLAHEDDVKILRWKEKYDQIPEDTKDPQLLRAKKDLKRKMPTRRSTEQYWIEQNFDKLRQAPPAKLVSRGPIPWRLLAYMLDASPDVDLMRKLVSKRLLDGTRIAGAQRQLDRMLLTLWAGGYVTLDPPPPAKTEEPAAGGAPTAPAPTRKITETERLLAAAGIVSAKEKIAAATPAPPPTYEPKFAHPTEQLEKLLMLRSVNPLYGLYLVSQLGIANREERIQAFESVLEMPGSVARMVRVPKLDQMPAGPLATTRLDSELLRLGLATPEQLGMPKEEEEDDRRGMFEEERVFVLTLGEKLRLVFDASYPDVHSLNTTSVWAAGGVLEYGGKFNQFITARGLQKQEGVIFRHLLRLILLLQEFLPLNPPEISAEEWTAEIDEISRTLIEGCRAVDPSSTDKALEEAEERRREDEDVRKAAAAAQADAVQEALAKKRAAFGSGL
jgi:superfamily II DNA/RNA helicase